MGRSAGAESITVGSEHNQDKDRIRNRTTKDKQTRQCTYNVIMRHGLLTAVAVEKVISITYSECVFVALVTQHGTRMRHIVIYGRLRSKFLKSNKYYVF